jgi:peptidoglycan/LPS O-acetylase OafA/YrhL
MGPGANIRPLPPLTSLRFFAAASIVIFHSAGHWGMPDRSYLHFGVGVDLFFILSGFILAYNYRSMASLADGLRVVGYRIARIWPLHLATLAGAMVFFAGPHDPFLEPERLWATIPMIQSWLGNYVYSLHGNSVSWTISVEFAFYLLFPLLTGMSDRALIATATVLSAATIAWALQYADVKGHADAVSGPAIMRLHPGSYIVQFAAGMLACRLFLGRRWTLSAGAATRIEIAAAALAVFFFFANLWLFLSFETVWPFPRATLFWLTHLYAIAFLVPIIFVLAIGRGAISAALSSRPLVFLGEISFATYMCHLIILMALQKSDLPAGYALTTYFGLTYFASAALYFGIERPAQRMLRRVTDALTGFGSSTRATRSRPGASPAEARADLNQN